MKFISAFLLLIATFIGLGCAENSKKIDLIHLHEANTFADQKSVFYSNDNLFDKDISTLLKTRIKLPAKIKIAIIKLQPKVEDSNYRNYRMAKDPAVQALNDTSPYLQDLLTGGQISAVLVPESLVPAKADIKWIRNLGATMQAHLVLVVDSRNDRYEDMQVIKKGIAMSVSSADTYLIDTLSGAILSAKTYTKDAFTKKEETDYDTYRTLDRARVTSEQKIFKNLASDVYDSIETIRK